MFPTANSVVYYNEDGEPLGWDTVREPDAWGADDDYYTSYNDYDEEIDPEDCEHGSVAYIEDSDGGRANGTCDDCGDPVTRLDGDGSWSLSRWS